MLRAAIAADWRLLLFGILMTFWSSPGQTYLISLFGGNLRTEFDLSHSQFGSIYSTATLLSAFVLIWSGKLVDTLHLRTISLIAIAGLALGCLTMASSQNVLMLLIAIFLLRQSGQGMMTLISSTAMVRYFDQIKGKASAICWLGFAAAEACLPIVTIYALQHFGWRTTWLVFATILSLFLLPAVIFLLNRHRKRHTHYLNQLAEQENTQVATNKRQWTRQEVLRDPRFYTYLPAQLSPAFFFTGFFFHQIYLIEYKGWDLTLWGSFFAIYAASAFLSTLISGPLVDRFNAIRHLPWYSLPLGIGLIALSLSNHQSIAIIFLILTGIGSGWNPTVTGPFWAEMYGSKHLASIKSMGSAMMVLSSAISPFLLGWLFDSGFQLNHVAFISGIIIISFSLLAFFGLAKTRKQLTELN